MAYGIGNMLREAAKRAMNVKTIQRSSQNAAKEERNRLEADLAAQRDSGDDLRVHHPAGAHVSSAGGLLAG